MVRVILVRHGQTPCNVMDRWHGWEDCDLTETGVAQAEAAARSLAGERIDALYSSDLRRAMQTARAIGRPHGLEPIADCGLRERSAGTLEGLYPHEVRAVYPTWQQDRSADYWTWAPPEGETFEQVLQRNLTVIDRLKQEHDGQTVVAVTHMGPVRVLISHLAGVPLADTYKTNFPFPSTGISVFLFEGDDVRVERLNDAAHIE
ncbi:MAG: alpha-ribazole phosphatase [Chloroflexota bacterium]